MTKYFWWLGVWDLGPTNRLRPVSGLIYWITAPDRVMSMRFLVYSLFILISGAIGSWLAILDEDKLENPDKLAEDLVYANKVTMHIKDPLKTNPTKLDSDVLLKEEIKRLVPTAAILGGIILGFVCIISDMYVIGGAQGMLVATNIMYSHYKAWEKEAGKVLKTRS
jgi:preprotein translocase subunit SecY